TTQGAPIPTQAGYIKDNNGEIVVPQLPRQQLDKLAQVNNGRYTDVSLDDKDIEFLLPAASNTTLNTNTTLSEREFDQWHDRGHLLVLLLIPLCLLAFRRGWLLVLPVFIFIEPQNSYAYEWKDLWQRADQQAAKALNNGDAKAAATLFENKQWHGTAQYKAEDFEAATKNFKQFNSPDDHYNHANALAKAGKLDEAIKAYNKALKQQPDMEDALFNKQLLEKLKEQQQQDSSDQKNDEDSEQSEDQDKKDQQNDQSKQNDDNQQQGDNKPQDADNNDSQNKEQNNEQKNNPPNEKDGADMPEEQSEQEKEKEQEQEKQSPPPQADDKSEQEQAAAQNSEEEKQDKEQPLSQAEQTQADKDEQQKQQATEQWLRQIPDDPSGLLRRKFDYEHRLRQQQATQSQREQPKW
ncbi:MAG: tetratricopeptide repeat protein, partial [Spongiibacteraceae bacterium]|nr:tetratricopeptide repeat protein [Spongiibacteraceae bacterium]